MHTKQTETVDIHALMQQLAVERPIFHSEADFQHALAWKIHELHPEAGVRLEYPQLAGMIAEAYFWLHPEAGVRLEYPLPPAVGQHLDIAVFMSSQTIFIELKYPSYVVKAAVGEELFSLKYHSAQDLGRKGFCIDIHRLETLVDAVPGITGYAVFLTNDPAYWVLPGTAAKGTNDRQFRIHDGRELRGPLTWGPFANDMASDVNARVVPLKGRYTLKWHDYSKLSSSEGLGTFKYVCVDVTPFSNLQPT